MNIPLSLTLSQPVLFIMAVVIGFGLGIIVATLMFQHLFKDELKEWKK